ncbi:hypothetical protein [Nostoc sp. FACHB-110]|uniref:hypothetical protein n=1 Tax=Nostoc sp. FACHB-110 TaxID=2692834 RepID=UPI001681F7AB|nr:hypothetical protein [Nostoc sp. FACHB-110]MBD2437377.1 hypothetical protein [Nostoc sp. FACHB-110]
MLKPQDPLTLYGPLGQIKRIPAVDAAGWLANGWSTQSIPESSETIGVEGEPESSELPSSPTKRRKAAVETVEEVTS